MGYLLYPAAEEGGFHSLEIMIVVNHYKLAPATLVQRIHGQVISASDNGELKGVAFTEPDGEFGDEAFGTYGQTPYMFGYTVDASHYNPSQGRVDPQYLAVIKTVLGDSMHLGGLSKDRMNQAMQVEKEAEQAKEQAAMSAIHGMG